MISRFSHLLISIFIVALSALVLTRFLIVSKNVINYLKMIKTYYLLVLMCLVGVTGNGLFDFSDIKNKLLQWKQEKIQSLCPSNGAKLQNLLNLVCSTAQPSNVTIRDACISCFSTVTAMPEGPQELTGLSVCATRYFTNTSYSSCAMNLMTLSTSALNVQATGCYMGYCDFVRCLRRINSMNLILQCTREARTGINITLDADNIKFFTNVTACILAKSRCGTFNPVTGEPQTPGLSSVGAKTSNALQFTASNDMRIITFPANTAVAAALCTTTTNLTQSSWLNNVC